MEETKVVLTLEEYNRLYEDSVKLDALLQGIIVSTDTRLSYDKKSWSFDGDEVPNLLKVLYPITYSEVLETLKAERERIEKVIRETEKGDET